MSKTKKLSGHEIYKRILEKVPESKDWLRYRERLLTEQELKIRQLEANGEEVKRLREQIGCQRTSAEIAAAEATRMKAMTDRLDRQEKLIERIWVDKAVIGLHYLQVLNKACTTRDSLDRAIKGILDDLPQTLVPGWEGRHAPR